MAVLSRHVPIFPQSIMSVYAFCMYSFGCFSKEKIKGYQPATSKQSTHQSATRAQLCAACFALAIGDSSSQPKAAAEKRHMPKGDNRAVWSQKKRRAREVDARYSREKEAEAPNILHTLKFVPMAFPLLFFLLFLVAMPFKGSGKASRFFLVFDCGTFVAGVAY
jgi:hypothetical protein